MPCSLRVRKPARYCAVSRSALNGMLVSATAPPSVGLRSIRATFLPK
jgi:hypothetical protein